MMPRNLQRKVLYALEVYYYERGEHISGYRVVGYTDNEAMAKRFEKEISQSDDSRSHHNRFHKVEDAYQGDNNKVYRISFAANMVPENFS